MVMTRLQLMGYSGHDINYDVTAEIPDGYELASCESANGTLTVAADDSDNIEIHLIHSAVEVTADITIGSNLGD